MVQNVIATMQSLLGGKMTEIEVVPKYLETYRLV